MILVGVAGSHTTDRTCARGVVDVVRLQESEGPAVRRRDRRLVRQAPQGRGCRSRSQRQVRAASDEHRRDGRQEDCADSRRAPRGQGGGATDTKRAGRGRDGYEEGRAGGRLRKGDAPSMSQRTGSATPTACSSAGMRARPTSHAEPGRSAGATRQYACRGLYATACR